jgi:glycosyltransferase involved in cell wall biosynthesis
MATEGQKQFQNDTNHTVLMHVTTVPETFGFLKGQIRYMKERGFEIHAISSPGRLLEETSKRENIAVHAIPMSRRITPGADMKSLFKLYCLFKEKKPAIVHAHTPKGGLLGVLAARLARVPIILYSMRGLPFVTKTGWKRKLLILTEILACRAADRVITVSLATKNKAAAEGLCLARKIVVPGNGSSNGVDAEERFNPEKLPSGSRSKIRERYQIPLEATVIGFVGRLVRDKGIVELAKAWQNLRDQYPNLYLLLVGPIEPQDPIPDDILEELKKDTRVKLTGLVDNSAPLYAAMDILTLPTYREGFPNTPLEAAAMKLPVVITDVDGCPEAVEDDATGIVVPPQNSLLLSEALDQLIQNPERRRTMGQEGRERVLKKFKPEIIWQRLYDTYIELMDLKGLTKPERYVYSLGNVGQASSNIVDADCLLAK